ncbi:MAG: Holliday junction branch migration protein RuvA [bacterium]|nr:Holliday junction branch migration protein RuvA [bacterium]
MIGELQGQVSSLGEREFILTVGGVGFKILASTATLAALTKAGPVPVRLLTHLAVREDALELYGFVDSSERDLFLLLISVSGIGPKSALAILSLAPVKILREAIASGQTDYLTRVSGIGKKSAGKIIVELKDKLLALGETEDSYLGGDADALDALISLGYNRREAREALQALPHEKRDVAERVKAALKLLGKNR